MSSLPPGKGRRYLRGCLPRGLAQRGSLGWVFVVYPGAWRQLNPGMSAAVIDRSLRRRKARVGKGAHGDTYIRLLVTLFGMEHGCPTDRAEPECEPGSLVTDANVLRCGARDLVGRGKVGQSGKDTARSTLAGEAVANADSEWFSLHFNT